MKREPTVGRRDFIKMSAAVGGGVLISVFLSSCSSGLDDTMAAATATSTPDPQLVFEPGVFLRIDGTGGVTVTIHRPDIGQGVRTAFAMIVADELGADWSQIHIEQAGADSRYGNQVTGGSLGVSESYMSLRRAGATARHVLVSAAAKIWGVAEDECSAESGALLHKPSGRRLSFADVVEVASGLPVPSRISVKLKARDDFTLIGTSPAPLDHPNIVTGRAAYASDLRLPGMLYAALARCPVPYGKLVRFEAAGAKGVEGVRAVLAVAGGVAVLADSSWAALQGRAKLDIAWDPGALADLNTRVVRSSLTERAVPSDWSGESTESGEISAVYEVPFFAHATQEPPCCVAQIQLDRCEVWASTQVPREALSVAAAAAGVSSSNVDLHIPMIGGGFGRRLKVDFIEETVAIAKLAGAPVKLLWTREDDLQHDYYHPFSIHFVRARLDRPSLPQVHSATYDRIPNGAWRSVTNFTEAFVRESFIDEMAVALVRDPLDLRLEIEPHALRPVLEKVAAEADWGSALPDGWGRGIACHSTWSVTPVAQVAEVSVSAAGEVRVHRIVCAIDPGLVIHPALVEAQMQGGIVFGLTAALKDSITFESGRVQQGNFHDYPLLRMNEMPSIEVHLMPSGEAPRGVGEMAVPPVAPAVMNAIYAATRVRVRQLPVRPEYLLQRQS